eukprot:CAMPEP_0180505742 /NCGR_PEP_ID=MMETSP1036_2-20121128/47549_1 /TAXON_ID=632150 /ORGANISM="Azadinium spinosum, Strain 3D9" /LENGTH=37 /DNA_ID= /DNA_START= /DNA_END= /DNA_ORIENTATION=
MTTGVSPSCGQRTCSQVIASTHSSEGDCCSMGPSRQA